MADVNKSISISYTADTKNLEKALKRIPGITEKEAKKAAGDLDNNFRKMERSADRTSKSVKSKMKSMTKGITKVGGAVAAVGVGAVALTQKFADLTNELVDAETKTGIAVDTLAGLRLAAEGSGQSFSNLEGGLIKFQQSMDQAGKGSKQLASTFEELGVDVKNSNGELRDADSVFNEAIASLGKMENATERNAKAMLLFGRQSGPALIQSGALQNLESMTQLATQFGVSVNENAIGAMGNFQRAMAQFETTSLGVFQNVIGQVAGEGFSMVGALDAITEGIVYFGSIAGDVIFAVGQSFENVIGLAMAASEALSGNVELAKILVQDLAKESNQAWNNLGNIFDRASTKVDDFSRLVAESRAPTEMKDFSTAVNDSTIAVNQLGTAVKQLPEISEELQFDTESWEKLFSISQDIRSDLVTPIDEVTRRFQKTNNQLESIFLNAEAMLDEITSKPVSEQTEEDLQAIFRLQQIMAEAEKEQHNNKKRFERDIAAIQLENHQDVLKQIEEEAQLRNEKIQDTISKIDEYGNHALNTFTSITTLISDLQQAEIDKIRERTDEQIEAIDRMNKSGVISSEEAARRRTRAEERYEKDVQEFRERSFKANQAGAIADVSFQGAIAATKAIADYGIPAGLIVAGLAAASTTAQILSIKSQTPPKFDVGGMVGANDPQQPDQVRADLLSGEAVLDRSTVKSLGGEQGVRSLQRGNQSPQVIVVQPFKHFDRFVKGARFNQPSRSGIGGY
tara:strand:- start:12512 stop:14734 length:2223 start_codon:yes stop_codon:yes gene_type:complete